VDFSFQRVCFHGFASTNSVHRSGLAA
jgi:hypothetical protein